MEGAGGQTGGVIGAGDHCRLATSQKQGGRRRKDERKERGGKLNGLARAEDKRRDVVVGLVAER